MLNELIVYYERVIRHYGTEKLSQSRLEFSPDFQIG